MDLLDWVGTLLRRWWLTVPLLLLSLSGTVAVAVVTPWTYQAQATGVLLASPFQAKQAGGNPWLVFDSSLTVTAEVVGREMMDERTAASLKARGLTAKYVIGVAPDSTGPVLKIEVTGSDPKVTQATLDALIKIVPERLTKLQAQESVAPRAQIKMNVISASPEATLVTTDKIRLCVMVLFVGLVLTVAVPLFAEVLSERRRAARERKGKDRPATPERRPVPAAPARPAGRDEIDPMGLTRPDMEIPGLPVKRRKPNGANGTAASTATDKAAKPAKAGKAGKPSAPSSASASSASNGSTPPSSARPAPSEPDA